MGRLRFLALVAVVALAAGAAFAQAEDPVALARTHFEAGRALYQLGSYHEAVREFAAGYQLAPRPQFLLNLGQCYRKLNDPGQAREMYQSYLREAPATDVERPQAEQILAEIEQQLADQHAAAAAPPPATKVTQRTLHADSAPATVTHSDAAAKKPFIKRHWWIIPTSAAVVGVAVGLGVYYGTRTNPCDNASLACWDLSKAQ